MASKTLKASVLIGGSISSSLRSALGTTKDGLAKIGQAITDVERKQRLLGNAIQTFGRQGRNVDGLRRQYDELTRSADRMRRAHERLASVQQRIDANNARRSELSGKFMGSAGATIGTLYALSQPTMNAANFSRENRLIGNTANMTREEVKALGQTIIRESKITNQGANELQKAIGFLVAAGLDVKTAEASIRTIGRTTTAAGADIEDLSKASFVLIDALKIKPEGLQGALDMLAMAGKEGNVELKDMARQLPVLGASFTALKMGGTEAVATMGAALEIARKGAKDADEAANNMQNFMVKVMSPETLKKAQKNFGLDLYAVITKAQKSGANPFEAAMEAIKKATGGDQKKIGELFQDMQVQAFLRPMIQNWDEYKRIKNKSQNESAGTTDRDFALMMEEDAEKFKAAKIQVDKLSKSLGTALSPAIGVVAEHVGKFAEGLTKLIDANPRVAAGVTGVVAGFLVLRTALIGARLAAVITRGGFLSLSRELRRNEARRAANSVSRLNGRLGGLETASGNAGRGILGLIGKLGMVLALSDMAIQGAGALGLPTPEEIEAQGNVVGAENIRRGEWLKASANLPASDFLKAVYERTIKGRTNEEVSANVGGVTAEQRRIEQEKRDAQAKPPGAAVQASQVGMKAGERPAEVLARSAPAATPGSSFGYNLPGSDSKNDFSVVPAAPSNPPLPKPAPAARAAASSTVVHQKNEIHITQRPGESSADLAKRVAEELRRAEQVKNRGSLADKQ